MRYVANQSDEYFGTRYTRGQEIILPSDVDPNVRIAAEKQMAWPVRRGVVTANADTGPLTVSSGANFTSPYILT